MDAAAATAAAKAAASGTLIVQSKRSRGGRRRGRKDDVADEMKEDRELAQKVQEKLQSKIDAEAALEKTKQQAEERALHEAEKHAAKLQLEIEKEKTKVLGIFENEVQRFNEVVRKAIAKFDKAAKFADRDKITLEIGKLNKLDNETDLLFKELGNVSERKSRKPKQKEDKNKNKNKKKVKEQAAVGESGVGNNSRPSSSSSSKKGPKLDKNIRKVLQTLLPQFVKDCLKISKKRMKAYVLTSKHVRDVISACGERGLIEEILDRKFKLYKIALYERREAGGEKDYSKNVPVSKDELVGLAGGYPVCTAARQGQHNVLKHLLEMLGGDSANGLDSNGVAPLLLAARAGYDLLTKMLLDFGAFADAVDSGRCNALMLAARQEDRFYHAERQRRTDLQKAFAKSKGGGKKQDEEDLIIKVGDKPQNLQFRPLEKNHNRVLKLLIAVGANINHRGKLIVLFPHFFLFSILL